MLIQQRYWSIIIDLALDIHTNITALTALQLMGFIYFCSLDCNGTMLPVAVVTNLMLTPRLFRSQVKDLGLYPTLSRECCRIAISRKVSVPGYSTEPRYQSHNKTSLVPDNEWENTMKRLISQCNTLREDTVRNKQRPPRPVSPVQKKRKKHAKDAKDAVVYRKTEDEMCSDFLENVRAICGLGTGHVFSLAFFQLSSMFGFIPSSLMSWASISSKGSGGFMFAESLQPGITVEQAQNNFTEAVGIIRGIYGWNVSACLIENILCELHREVKSGESKKFDCVFELQHREGRMQNFYRFQFKGAATVSLEVLPWTAEEALGGKKQHGKDVGVVKKVVLSEWKSNQFSCGAHVNWEITGSRLKPSSKLWVSDDIKMLFPCQLS